MTKNERPGSGGIGKGADAMTVNRWLVEDPFFSGDLAGRGENQRNLGRTNLLNPSILSRIRLCRPLGIWGLHIAIFRMGGAILRSHTLWKRSGLQLRNNWKN